MINKEMFWYHMDMALSHYKKADEIYRKHRIDIAIEKFKE